MLSALKIQNYALIQSLDIAFLKGLNIITGETGTGKSILLGALGLILGNRADTNALLDPDIKCVIEGRFMISGYNLQDFFESNDLDWEETTILRREISTNGKSRAFINDTPVNLNILSALGEKLVDIHSQHQTLNLSDPKFQMFLLDGYAQQKIELDTYYKAYKQFRNDENELISLNQQAANAKKEYDFNLFQFSELEAANLQPEELEALEGEFSLLTNAETIKQNLQNVIFDLHEDETGINNRLSGIKRQLGSIANLHSNIQEIYTRVESVLIETKDLYQEINAFHDSIFIDSERLDFVNERLRTINNLLVKHQLKTELQLINYADELRYKLINAESVSARIEEIQSRIISSKIELLKLAENISRNRQSQIEKLESEIILLLHQAGIPEAIIKIDLKQSDHLNDTGIDFIEILFSANKGNKPMPVSQVASGGELSRLMLCFKYILADSIFLPTIIFDEIDSGVSGEVAIKVGQMIKRLSSGHQVICITHLPQVAAMGDHHFVVHKVSGEDITVTNIRQINNSERIEEIAKMIGGYNASPVAFENARELLGYSS